MPKISIVILQYNHSSHTLACLESVARLTYPNFNVIVVDNGSDDREYLEVKYWIENHGTWNIEQSSKNLGYGGGNNIGIKKALENGADYVLILNNDTIVEPDFLQVSGADVTGPFIHKIKWLAPQGFPDGDLSKNTSYINGAAMLVRREVFEKIGFFDESYFLYFEDADFCFRARNAGFTLSTMPEKIHHVESGSMGSVTDKLTINARNARKFFAHHAPWYVRIMLPLWYPLAILYARLYGNYRDRMRVN